MSDQHALDYRLKLKLEVQLAKKMKGIFRNMASESEVHYKNTGQILNTSKYNIEINAVLREHYRKTSRVFESRLRDDIQKSFPLGRYETKALSERVKQDINAYIYRRSIEQTSFISETNSKEMISAFQRNILAATLASQRMSRDKVAEDASQEFKTRAFGRATTIGMTETQNVAEKTKDIEANSLIEEALSISLPEGNLTLTADAYSKTWSTVLDDKTRTSHALADDQTVAQEEPFTVQGQSLMFPGDDSMGATIDNIINCRCNTIRAVDLSGLPSWIVRPANQAPSNRR